MDLIFNNQIVKVINRDSEPFFYGSELAKMLNYARPGNALENHVSEENKIIVCRACRVGFEGIAAPRLLLSILLRIESCDFRQKSIVCINWAASLFKLHLAAFFSAFGL